MLIFYNLDLKGTTFSNAIVFYQIYPFATRDSKSQIKIYKNAELQRMINET